MQTYPYTSKVAAALVLFGAFGVAYAAPVGVGVGAAASGGIAPGAFPGSSLNSGATFGGGAGRVGAGGGFGASNGAASVGANGLPDVHANASGVETIGMRQERLTSGADMAGGAALNAPGMAVANQHALEAVANAGPTAAKIRSTTVDDREKLATDIDTQIKATDKALGNVKAQTKAMNAEQRTEFRAATKDMETREKALRKSLKNARKASAETWAAADAEVATNYDAYVQAAQRAQALASATSTESTSANAAASAVK